MTVRDSDFSAPRPKVCLIHEDKYTNECACLNFYSRDEAVEWLERNLEGLIS
jgi:hypothetical protein